MIVLVYRTYNLGIKATDFEGTTEHQRRIGDQDCV